MYNLQSPSFFVSGNKLFDMPDVPDPYGSSKFNFNASNSLTQLAADLLIILAKGEKLVSS